MFKDFIKKTLFFALIVVFCSSQAFIYKGTVWKKHNPKSGRDQYLYCLSDMHVNMGRNNHVAGYDIEQRQVLLDMLARCPRESTKVIVEDSRAAAQAAGIPLQAGSDALLVGLVSDCQVKNLDVCNIECRARRIFAQNTYFFIQFLNQKIKRLKEEIKYCQAKDDGHGVMSRSFELNSLESQTDDAKKRDVLIAHILKELNQAVEQIRMYKDSELLNDYYAATIERIMKDGQKVLQKLSGVQDYFAYYLAGNIPESYRNVSSLSFTGFAAELLDMKAVHEIYQAHNKDRIFVVLGGVHVKNIEQILPKMEYQQVATEGQEYDVFMQDPYVQNIEKIWDQTLDINAFNAETKALAGQQEQQLPSMRPIDASFFEQCVPESAVQACGKDEAESKSEADKVIDNLNSAQNPPKNQDSILDEMMTSWDC